MALGIHLPWDFQFDVKDIFNDDDLSVEEKGRAIAAKMRLQPWCDDEVETLFAEDLEEVLDEVDFDWVWQDFCDFCDQRGIWVRTF